MDISKEKDEKYEKVVLALNRTICDNLLALLEARGLSKRSFCKQLAEEKTSVTRTYFTKVLKNPQHISAAFLLSCCDFFGITLLFKIWFRLNLTRLNMFIMIQMNIRNILILNHY